MIPKPIRRRAFDFGEFKCGQYVDAHTNEAEAWLREQLAEYARIEQPMSCDIPGRITFYLKGFDLADVEAYLQAAWIERAEAWPEDVAVEEGASSEASNL